MTKRDSLLNQGIAAAEAGDRTTARRFLTRAVRRDPDSEAAWLWLSAVLDTPRGKAFCLRRVLALNPDNQAAQRGLSALEKAPSAPTLVAQPLPVPTVPSTPARRPPILEDLVQRLPSLEGLGQRLPVPRDLVRRLPTARDLTRQPRFWQVVVACLAIVALGLVAVLVYAVAGGGASDEEVLAAVSTPTLGPRGTLRPTFTSTPTRTPTPTDTPTPTPTPTFTPTPTDTPTPTPTATRRPRRRSPTDTPTPTPRPTLPPRVWDSRLTQLGVRIEPAFVGEGQPYWRLVEARWADELESAGKHSIFVEVLGPYDRRAVGQQVVFEWRDDNMILPVKDRPRPDWGVDFAMYNTLGSYAVNVIGMPSDRIVGLGLGTAQAPRFTIHTSFYLTFRLVYR